MTNGSERIPEHPAETDYKALVEEARVYADVLVGGESANWLQLVQHANSLADAVEALLAENEKLREREGCDHLDGPYRRLLAERDALRAQLDSMTIDWEWGTALKSESGELWDDFWCASKEEALSALVEDAPEDHAPDTVVLIKRTRAVPAGPWVEVQEGDK